MVICNCSISYSIFSILGSHSVSFSQIRSSPLSCINPSSSALTTIFPLSLYSSNFSHLSSPCFTYLSLNYAIFFKYSLLLSTASSTFIFYKIDLISKISLSPLGDSDLYTFDGPDIILLFYVCISDAHSWKSSKF